MMIIVLVIVCSFEEYKHKDHTKYTSSLLLCPKTITKHLYY